MIAFFRFILIKIKSGLKSSEMDFRILQMMIIGSGVSLALFAVLLGYTGKTMNGFCGI